MERLYELHEQGDYDLLVVDTPPSLNALDLLDAPGRMAEFFSSRLLRWLVVPYRSRLVNLASAALLPGRGPHPGQPVPGGPGGFLHSLPDDAGRVRRPGRGREPPPARRAHDVRGRDDARSRAGRGGRTAHREPARPGVCTWAFSCATGCCPGPFSDPPVGRIAELLGQRSERARRVPGEPSARGG